MNICIIKLGALGDVVRTLPILIAIKERFPDSKITWVTKENAEEIVKSSKYIDNVITLPNEPKEKFDILYNFDIDKEATALALKIQSQKKIGFYKEGDYVASFNFSAEYYLNTLFDDILKKENKKCYQEMIFEAAELPYRNQHHPLVLTKDYENFARDFEKKESINPNNLIGIHIGASSQRWPSKSWHLSCIKEFIRKVLDRGYEIIIFAGPGDIEKQEEIIKEFKNNPRVHKNNPLNTIMQFASLVNLCKHVVCFDSLAMHISLALKKPTTALFFVTSPNEVEGYGILNKISSPLLKDFFPEKMDQYDESLIKSISVNEVLKTIRGNNNK